MPDLFDLFGRYFWLIALGMAVLNALIVWRRAAPAMAQQPELQEGYVRLISGYAAIQMVPWLVMGLGVWLGGIPTIWPYLDPRESSPWVLAWWGIQIGINLLLFLWIFFQGGAQYIEAHPGFRPGRGRMSIKLQAVLGLLGLVWALGFLWFANVPIE